MSAPQASIDRAEATRGDHVAPSRTGGRGHAGERRPTPVRTPADSRRQERIEAIVSAAVNLFTVRAYDDVSIDDIASGAGVAHGLISYYFEGKRGVYAAAVTQVSDEFLAFQWPRADETSIGDRLTGLLYRHFQYVREHPDRYRLLIQSSYPDPELQTTLAATRSAAVTESLRCPIDRSGLLGASLNAWAGFLESATRCWLTDTSLRVDDVVDLCVHTLVSTVHVASGFRHDADVVVTALAKAST